MRKIIYGMLAAVCLISTFYCGGASAAVEQEKVSINPVTGEKEILAKLPNGLLVYIVRDPRFQLACTRLYVRAGSANEEPGQAGISHVLEHMVFKGTSHRPKGQVAKDVEALGGYLNAATSFDKTWYLTDMPAAHWRTGMDVVKEMAFQATLDSAELEAEKEVVISELQRGEDSPARKLYESLQIAALKNTPYGRPIIGYENTIRSITAKDLHAYVKRWYQPQNMMLLVAGDIDPEEVLNYAQKLFGDMKNSSDLFLPEPLDLQEAAKGSPVVEVVNAPWNKVYLGIAIPVPGIRDLRSIDLDVLSYLLGGDDASTLYQKYKYELQLVDSINVGNMSLARAGLFTITAQLDADKVETFWRELTSDLGKLNARDFLPKAIQRAKFNLEDSMDRAGETLTGLTSWLGSLQFDLGGAQGEKNIRFTQNNVDYAQLQKAISSWLDSGNARIRVIAPKNATMPDFAAIMKQNWPPAVKNDSLDKNRNNSGAVAETVELKNGCTLIMLPDKSVPYIAINMIMPGGNAMLAGDQQGLASLTARMLMDGSGDKNNIVMSRWISERAAAISANAGMQTFTVSLTGPSRFNSDFFAIFNDIIRKPRFEPAELKREVQDMKSAIVRRNDQPLSYIFARLKQFLFPGTQPYGYDSLGDDSTLDTFNIDSVHKFWSMQSAQPWVLAISGDFEREAVIGFANTLPDPFEPRFAVKDPTWGKDKNLVLNLPGRNQAHLLQVFRTVPVTSPDVPGLMLLETILSGQSGLLFSKLRDEQGLGYTVTAFNRTMPLAGYMAFYIGSTPDKIEKAREGFAKIIKQIREQPFDKSVLESAANRLLGEYVRERQSLGARATEAAKDKLFGYPQDFQKMLIDRAAALTPEDVQKIAQKYLVEPYDITLLP